MTETMRLDGWVRGLIAELDPKLTPTSDGYSEAAILFSSYVVGASEPVIAHELGYDPEFVDLVGNRLRTAKLWQGDDLTQTTKDRWDGENGGIAMFLDVNIARGSMVVVRYENGEPMYSLSQMGERDVKRILGIA